MFSTRIRFLRDTKHRAPAAVAPLLAVLLLFCSGCAKNDSATDTETVETLGGTYEIHLNFDFSNITDEDLARLELSPAVKSISLANCPITDKGVADLKRATGLERLNLNGTRVTDGVVDHLRDMPSLVQAHFGPEQVSPEAKRELSDLLTARAARIAAELRNQPPVSPSEQKSSYGKQ